MLSASAAELPSGEEWQFEPKWDGFRTIVFRDGDEVLLQSRDERPMNRYFPELEAPSRLRCQTGAWWMARSSSLAHTGSILRRCCCASIPLRRGWRCW